MVNLGIFHFFHSMKKQLVPNSLRENKKILFDSKCAPRGTNRHPPQATSSHNSWLLWKLIEKILI